MRLRVFQRVMLLLIAGGTLLLGREVFGSLHVGTSPEAVRRFVHEAGWWGPAIFVLLFLFRSVLLLPSVVLLTAGGVCFGLLGGAVFGSLGLTFSATIKLLIAHVAGRDELIARLPAGWRERIAALDGRTGVGTLALVTAYPIGPAEMLHIAAILAGMGAVPFVAAVLAGSFVRAGSFSLFGEAIAAGRGLVLAAVVLTLAAVLPLAVPGLRQRLLAAQFSGAPK